MLRRRGFAAATTKEIASAAGLSEAMLYAVFRDKVDLFLAVLTERLPRVALVSDGFAGQVGNGALAANLERLAAELLAFYLHRAFLTRFNGGDLTKRGLEKFATDLVDALRPMLEPEH